MEILSLPILAYSSARSASFNLQFSALNALARSLPGGRKHKPWQPGRGLTRQLQQDIRELLARDARNIARGVYPVSVLKPEPISRSVLRLPKLLADSYGIYRRRSKGRTQSFSPEARDYLDELPRYYRRNFHFQTDGYLSDHSAELYDHQVEMLFSGAADAMRRMIIEPMREALGTRDGKGMTFLELACGTGSATRFMRLAFPKARIVATDLSDAYLRHARKRLENEPRVDLLCADAANLPFQDAKFDAVYSVFLFHELPLEERKKVLAESKRVLRKGGFMGLVDSMQYGDRDYLREMLDNFPKNYHEPFYRNYAQNPMEKLVAAKGFRKVGTELGFLSKAVWGTRA